MPAKWSKYDDQRLPNPKDDPGDDAKVDDNGPSKRLQMNWTAPNPPKTVAPPATSGGSEGSGGGSGGGGGSGPGGSKGGDGPPPPPDIDDSYQNPNPVGRLPAGTPLINTPPEYDKLEVDTGGMTAYEQNILTAATNLVGQFNTLRDRSQSILDDPMWGKGEGHWHTQHPGHQGIDDADTTPHFVHTNSAIEADEFTKSIGPAQQGALQNTADMITLSGMFIEVLDASVSSYAQMDQLAVFPDPAKLKTSADQ